MADKMDIDAVNGEKEEEKVGPAPPLPAERSKLLSWSYVQTPPSFILTDYNTVITNNFTLINQAVDAFDSRFTLRALRNISTIRKATNFPEAIAIGIRTAFPKPQNNARRVLEAMLPEQHRGVQNGEATDAKDPDVVEVAEVWAYLGVLVQVCNLNEE